jgi:hypothetical protein
MLMHSSLLNYVERRSPDEISDVQIFVRSAVPRSSLRRDLRLETVTWIPSRLVWTSFPSQRPVQSFRHEKA